jgi:hypothetical protein
LREFFPDTQIVTGGTQAKQGLEIPATVESIAHRWNLLKFDRESRQVDDNWIKESSPSILVADQLVEGVLKEVHRNQKICKLSDFADDSRLVPIDPTGLKFDDLAIELAKVSILTLRWAARETNQKLSVGSYLLPESKVGRLNAEEMTRNPNLLLIDTELTIPNPQRWNTNWNVHSINFRKLDEFDERVLTLEPTILVSKYEIDNPEEIYTSLQWQKFLLRLASVKDTKLVSVFSSVNKRNVSTAYLALLHTSSTTIVAS